MTTRLPLLEKCSADEIEQILELSRRCKPRFSDAVKNILDISRELGMPEQTARLAVASECVAIAAAIYRGDREFFVLSASVAIETAERARKNREDAA